MNTQMSLELAVRTLGVSSRVTLMLSEERDKEIVIKQREEYERWKREN